MNEDIVLDASDFQGVEYFVQQKKVNKKSELSAIFREYINENKSERIKSQVATKVMTLSGEEKFLVM